MGDLPASLLVLVYALSTALWVYSEALVASRVSVSLVGGFSVGLLGWAGVLIASLAKLPLSRLLSSPSSRRLALLLAAVLLSLSALVSWLNLGGALSYVILYALVSAAYGLVAAAVFSTLLSDVDYLDWRSTIVSASIATYAVSLSILALWSLSSVSLAAPLAVASAILTARLALSIRASLIPSIELKTVEVIADILSFRRSPEAYRMWYVDVAKLALILGGLGALKVTLLSSTVRDHGVTALTAIAAGSLAASILAAQTLNTRLAALLALPPAVSTLAGHQLPSLALAGLAITYSHLAVLTTILENRPKAVYRATAILSIATALGAAIVSLTSLANPQIASKTSTILTLTLLAITLTLTIKERRKPRWEN